VPKASVVLRRVPDGFAIPEDMAGRVTYDAGTRQLTCNGPLPVEDRDRLLAMVTTSTDPGAAAVEQAPIQQVCTQSWGYCVFGKVVEGLDVVDKIRNTPVANHPKYASPQPCTPVEPVVIKSVTRVAK